MTRRDAVWSLTLLPAYPLLAADNKQLSADELEKLLKDQKNLFFLDVREPQEIERLGSIKGYVNIPLGQLESRLSEIPRNKLIVTA